MSAQPTDAPVSTLVAPGSFERAGDARSSTARRDALVTQYRPYVYKIARAVAVSLRNRVDVDDLAGWGFIGLLEAASRYDEARGVTFRAYAHYRIRGAIFDNLRCEFNHSPALAMRFETTAETTCADAGYADVAKSGRRVPTPVVPGDAWTLGAASSFEPPDRVVWLGELQTSLDDALSALSPVELALVRGHYVNGETVQAIAKRLGLSKSWLSRVHARALEKLRDRLVAAAVDDARGVA